MIFKLLIAIVIQKIYKFNLLNFVYKYLNHYYFILTIFTY